MLLAPSWDLMGMVGSTSGSSGLVLAIKSPKIRVNIFHFEEPFQYPTESISEKLMSQDNYEYSLYTDQIEISPIFLRSIV